MAGTSAGARLGWLTRRGQRLPRDPQQRARIAAIEEHAAATFAGPVRGGRPAAPAKSSPPVRGQRVRVAPTDRDSRRAEQLRREIAEHQAAWDKLAEQYRGFGLSDSEVTNNQNARYYHREQMQRLQKQLARLQ